ncbi:AAA family ATPase (plasmid) [Pseudorhodobacter turbinis]|uniref:AAA family ATPase n=1 Tax=Pseudorhodobacter turbinis TaxID=2500533 RepID=A0A4P8EJE2_9RHOB|nr:helicase RepA family protein [Pseudorhodobacter turbinis]QCO56963.1 AAA family ATPase [Pseudorhodobacter turbinis]
MADGGFDRMAEIDAMHRAEMGAGYIVPKSNARAADLSLQLKPLSKIKAVLSSRYLVKGWLDQGAFSVVYGESNVGKTFYALDLALHVAAGKPWHGNKVRDCQTCPGPVVYVAGEGGAGINNRIEAIRRDRPDLAEQIDDNPDFLLLSTTLDLCTSEDAQHLIDALSEGTAPALIVIDTLARSMGNGDENTAKDMGAFVRSVDLLRAKTGAHVMVIHHSGKDTSKGARGSGSLRAAADTEIELTRDGAVILAETKKQRDMTCGAIFAYTLKSVFLGIDEDGDKVSSAVVEPTEAPAKRAPRLKGQALIAMQAFGDALAAHGEVKHGEDFPTNRQCVSLDHWREACDRHHLTDGGSDSAARQAFGRAWKSLQEKEIIRVIDGFAWRCADA